MSQQRTVWKFLLAPDEWTKLPPMVAPRIIHVGKDPASSSPFPSIWVDHGDLWYGSDEHELQVTFVGTGHPVPQHSRHAGSCQIGPFMWHVYYDPSAPQDL